jgi:EAL domain-containing protein (putative c-di-GMP-specific phosphodiesterase class I)
VLDLANNFGLKSVAEGVEDEATLDALRGLGCTVGQGYAIGRPMSDSALIDWFMAH